MNVVLSKSINLRLNVWCASNRFPKHTSFMTWLRSQWCPKVTNLPPRCTPDEPKSDQEVPPGTTEGTQARYISSTAHPWGANECFVGRSWRLLAPPEAFKWGTWCPNVTTGTPRNALGSLLDQSWRPLTHPGERTLTNRCFLDRFGEEIQRRSKAI